MLAILGAIVFAIAAFVAFFGGSVSVTGLLAVGLFFVALHFAGVSDYISSRRRTRTRAP